VLDALSCLEALDTESDHKTDVLENIDIYVYVGIEITLDADYRKLLINAYTTDKYICKLYILVKVDTVHLQGLIT
jgi:hypothetical protein